MGGPRRKQGRPKKPEQDGSCSQETSQPDNKSKSGKPKSGGKRRGTKSGKPSAPSVTNGTSKKRVPRARFQVVVRRIPASYTTVKQLVRAICDSNPEVAAKYSDGQLLLQSVSGFFPGREASEYRIARSGSCFFHFKNKAGAVECCELLDSISIPEQVARSDVDKSTHPTDDATKTVVGAPNKVAAGPKEASEEVGTNHSQHSDDPNITMAVITCDFALLTKAQIPVRRNVRRVQMGTLAQDGFFKQFLELESARGSALFKSSEARIESLAKELSIKNMGDNTQKTGALVQYLKDTRKKPAKKVNNKRRKAKPERSSNQGVKETQLKPGSVVVLKGGADASVSSVVDSKSRKVRGPTKAKTSKDSKRRGRGKKANQDKD